MDAVQETKTNSQQKNIENQYLSGGPCGVGQVLETTCCWYEIRLCVSGMNLVLKRPSLLLLINQSLETKCRKLLEYLLKVVSICKQKFFARAGQNKGIKI